MKSFKLFYCVLMVSVANIVLANDVVPAKSASAKSIQSVKEVVTLGTIEQAENTVKKAAKVGSEWRDTAKMIQSAKEALVKGDFITARHLADEATYQGELAYKQGVRQKHLEFPAYLQ